jgi:hypothetical protein
MPTLHQCLSGPRQAASAGHPRALDILIYLADRPGEVIAERDAPQDDLSKGR